ncbi:MAG: hypothetical protein CME34_19705 [Gordonia sp.]|uniref:hypothetical protein n=1 Tax=Gordonia sp. (in: high G+C Gram-positive bacteria) TaxID=84139 RepID=UPI000C4F0665|nr:hypothetical protein [Gordonia sp. (in: high G+C Gram-positive bacteria)]MAU84051.1 hypothetical protein [Gordonia sp. (in: high G+C Gram-positive bacteria)]
MTSIDRKNAGPQIDLDEAVRTISAWTRNTDSFTRTVERWMQSPIDYVLLSQDRRPVVAQHAAALDVPTRTIALHRHGLLRTAGHEAPIVVAAVRATVVEERLSDSVQQSLRSGKLPLGAVLGGYNVRRHTHSITPVSDRDEFGAQALHVNATLTTAGELVAVVDETIYQRLLQHGARSTTSPDND